VIFAEGKLSFGENHAQVLSIKAIQCI